MRHNRLTAAILVLGLLSCRPDRATVVAKLIEDRMETRLDQYQSGEWEACRRKAMLDAGRMADSLLRANPLIIQLDSLQRPPIPPRPIRPEVMKKPDSIVIAPLLPLTHPPDSLQSEIDDDRR